MSAPEGYEPEHTMMEIMTELSRKVATIHGTNVEITLTVPKSVIDYLSLQFSVKAKVAMADPSVKITEVWTDFGNIKLKEKQ